MYSPSDTNIAQTIERTQPQTTRLIILLWKAYRQNQVPSVIFIHPNKQMFILHTEFMYIYTLTTPPRPHLLHPWLVPRAHPNNPSPKIPNPLVLRQTHPLPFPLRHTNARRLSANTSYHTSC